MMTGPGGWSAARRLGLFAASSVLPVRAPFYTPPSLFAAAGLDTPASTTRVMALKMSPMSIRWTNLSRMRFVLDMMWRSPFVRLINIKL